MLRRELLIGCGNRREKILGRPGHEKFENLTTLDSSAECNPDILFDLEFLTGRTDPLDKLGRALPFDDDTFDEIHAYEVIEHCGAQGDALTFFDQFSEFWRVLKPGGHFFATVPHHTSLWAWGDPSHTRVINRGTITFLDQSMYAQIGKTPMSDFRDIYRADFKCLQDGTFGETDMMSYWFILEAVKPARSLER